MPGRTSRWGRGPLGHAQDDHETFDRGRRCAPARSRSSARARAARSRVVRSGRRLGHSGDAGLSQEQLRSGPRRVPATAQIRPTQRSAMSRRAAGLASTRERGAGRSRGPPGSACCDVPGGLAPAIRPGVGSAACGLRPCWVGAVSDVNRRFLLRERPTGRIDDRTFELVEEPVPEIGEGEALVRTRLDLARSRRTAPGSARRRRTCRRSPSARSCAPSGSAAVVASKHRRTTRWASSSRACTGWQDYVVASDAAPLTAMPEIPGVSPSCFLGRARNDRAHRLRRDARDRQAQAGRDGRRVGGRGRGRLGRRPARQDRTAPASSASPAGRRSARS